MVLRMDKGIRDKWADALESGEYKQGTGALHKDGEFFCCLGVLCHIAYQSGAPVTVVRDSIDGWQYDGGRSTLPDSVIDWAKMTYDGERSVAEGGDRTNVEGSGRFGDSKGDSLMALNDMVGVDFKGIARVIREQVEVIEP